MKNSQAPIRFTPLLVRGLATVVLSLAGGSAFAAPQTYETYSVKVQYNTRDLTTQAGTLKVYSKIKNAARRACRMASAEWDPVRMRHYWQCYNTALAKGVDDVNSKNLTALHQQGTKQKHPG
jgi:UrcA family protein